MVHVEVMSVHLHGGGGFRPEGQTGVLFFFFKFFFLKAPKKTLAGLASFCAKFEATSEAWTERLECAFGDIGLNRRVSENVDTTKMHVCWEA